MTAQAPEPQNPQPQNSQSTEPSTTPGTSAAGQGGNQQPAGDPQQQPPAGGQPGSEPQGASGDQPLGPNGEKALQAERDARKELEKQLNGLKSGLAEALGGGEAGKGSGKSEIEQLSERLATHEEELATERKARWRAEVAHQKGLTAEQAERLSGSTREEMANDADALLSLFATQPASSTPKPDPSQGAKGSSAATDLDSRIAEAEEKGDTRTAIALKARKLTQSNT